MIDRVSGGRVRKLGLDSGLVTENILEEIGKAWEEWRDKDDSNIGMMHGEVLIQK